MGQTGNELSMTGITYPYQGIALASRDIYPTILIARPPGQVRNPQTVL